MLTHRESGDKFQGMKNFESISINHTKIFREDLPAFNANWKGDPAIPDFLQVWADETPTFPALTSGSTGNPTTVFLQKAYAWASARATVDFLNLSPGTDILLSMPAAYIAGRMMIVRALAGAFNLIPVRPSSRPTIPALPLELAAFTPHQFHHIVDSLDKPNTLKIRNVLLGGAPVSSGLMEKVKEFQGRIFETFGMTETYSHVAMRMRYPVDEPYFEAVGPVTFSQKNDLLIIHAPHLGIEALQTRDVVKLYGKKRMEWLGRADNVINSGGVKIHPELVEKKLVPHIKNPYFITSQDDPKYGQRVVLVIEKGKDGLENPHLLHRINEILGRYEKPKSTVWVDTMIYTKTGKINRKATCQHYRI